MTAIQIRFMTPATNSSAINAQQHPTQKAAWRRPSCIAIVALDGLSTAPHGERQRVRQVCFNGVNWKRPAVASTVALNGTLTLSIIGETRAALSSAQCKRVAPTLKPPHAMRYPAMTPAAGAEPPMRIRTTITGRTDGSIIAAIITAHI